MEYIDKRGLNQNEIDYLKTVKEERRQAREIEEYEIGLDDDYLRRIRNESCECSGEKDE